MEKWRDYLLIACLGALLFLPFLGQAHLFDWDEINFAEASREMVLTGNYTQTQVDFRQFWEKPPLFFWMQATAMQLFGINEFSARFPNAVCGILTLMLLFAIGKRLMDKRMGILWMLCYAGSILPQFYFKSGIIDPWFNLFIFLGVYGFVRYMHEDKRLLWLCISAVAAGLSALTKGPVGIALIGLTILVYYIIQRFRGFPSAKHIGVYVLCVLLPIVPWVSIEIAQNGTWFIKEFFIYQLRLATTEDASHGGFFGYHFVVLLFFCFPASTFAIGSFLHKQPLAQQVTDMRKWMIILLLVVLIVFSIVQTKIAHYSSMAYFPLTFLAALRLHGLQRASRIELVLLLLTGVVIGVLMIGIPYMLQHPDQLLPYVQDAFTQQAIFADAPWTGWEWLIGAILLILVVLSALQLRKSFAPNAVYVLFVLSMLIINIAMVVYTPRIERYSQGAMVDFFIDKSDEDCYTDVAGYKSYAHLFYGARTAEDVNNPIFLQWLANQGLDLQELTAIESRNAYGRWLLTGNIDKPAYFVTNIRKAGQFKDKAGLIPIEEKNGFYFFMRKPIPEP